VSDKVVASERQEAVACHQSHITRLQCGPGLMVDQPHSSSNYSSLGSRSALESRSTPAAASLSPTPLKHVQNF